MTSKQILTIVWSVAFIVGIIAMNFANAQMPSVEQRERGVNSAYHNADMLETISSITERCTSDFELQDFSTYQACINFITTLEKHLDQSLKESQVDIASIRGY